MGMKIINGITIHYRDYSTDMGVIQEVFFEDSYNIREILGGSVVVDIGAHILRGV